MNKKNVVLTVIFLSVFMVLAYIYMQTVYKQSGAEEMFHSEEAPVEQLKDYANRKIVLHFDTSTASESEVKAFSKELEEFPGVESIHYVSSEEALVSFKERNQHLIQPLSELEENPFSPSIEIRLNDLSQKPAIISHINGSGLELNVSTSNF